MARRNITDRILKCPTKIPKYTMKIWPYKGKTLEHVFNVDKRFLRWALSRGIKFPKRVETFLKYKLKDYEVDNGKERSKESIRQNEGCESNRKESCKESCEEKVTA